MTTQRWSPLVEPLEYIGGLGFYLLMVLFVAIVSGISDDTERGAIILAIHLALTVIFTVIPFRLLKKRLLRLCTVSEGFPPRVETKAVLEGRIIEAGDGVISPYTRTPCVAWGMVEDASPGRGFPHAVWHTRPFLFEDRRGRGRILIEPIDPSGNPGFDDGIPDLIVATYINPDFCPAEKKTEIALALAEARGESSPRSWSCPSYEIVVQDGDEAVIRGSLVEREPGSGIPGVRAYELRSAHIELGTAEAILTRHGSYWYGMWGSSLLLGSFIATFLLVPLEIIFG